MSFFNSGFSSAGRNMESANGTEMKNGHTYQERNAEWVAMTDMNGVPFWRHRETGQSYYGNLVSPTPVNVVSPTAPHMVHSSALPHVYQPPAPWGTPMLVPVSPKYVIPDIKDNETRQK